MAERITRPRTRSLWYAHPNIRLRLTVTFVNRFLNYLLTPLMGILFAAAFGTATAGLLLLAIVCVTILSTFVGGHLADVRGRRSTLLISEAGVIVAYAVMAAANSPWWHSAGATFGCFLVNSCMGGLGYPANDAVMVDVADPEIRVALYTASYWLQNVSSAAGLTVGGLTFGANFEILPLLGLGLSASTYLLTVFALAETRPKDPDRHVERGRNRTYDSLRQYGTVVRDRPFMQLFAAGILIGAVELQLGYYLGIHLATHFRRRLLDLGGVRVTLDGVRMLTVMRTLNTVLVVLLALSIGSLLKKFSHRVRLFAGIGTFCGGFAAIAVTGDAWLLIGLSFVYTIGELMHAPARQVLLAELVDKHRRARYMALYGMRFRIGGIIASLSVVIGTVLPPVGMGGLYLLLGAAASMLLLTPLRRYAERARAAVAAGPPLVSTSKKV